MSRSKPKADFPFNTCSVAVRAYSNKEKTLQLPLKIKWSRLQAERNYEIKELENKDYYNFSAMDIGGEIKASIRSLDEKHKGDATIIFGPIRFDDNLRQPLESVLLSGFSKFNVMVQEDSTSSADKVQPISVFMSPNQVKFFYYTGNEEENFFVEITNEKPRLEIVYGEAENLVLYFDEVGTETETKFKMKIFQECGDEEPEQYKVQLRFFSRNSRDIFVTAMRLFRIVPVVTLSNLFRQIDVLLRENRLFEGNNKVTLNEILVEYDLLRTNLLNTIEYAKGLDQEKEELQVSLTVLERDLEHTMIEFRKFITENVAMQQSQASPSPVQVPRDRQAEGMRKLDELNASLLSNRGDMKNLIKKKLDETNQDVKEKAIRATASGDMDKLQKELESMRKLNAMYVKKLKEYQSKDTRKKEAYRGIKESMNNVSKEITNWKELNDSMQKEKDVNLGLQSKMFDVSGIESKMDEEDIFHSNPFTLDPLTAFKKGKPDHNKTSNSNLFKIDEREEKDKANVSMNNRLELRVKEEEVSMLRSRIKELERSLLEAQTKENATKPASSRNLQASDSQSTARFDELTVEVSKLKSRESELRIEADKGMQFIEEFRKLVKAVLADDESVYKPHMNSSLIDESLVNDVFKVNQSTKMKLLDLENDNLKKRIESLRKEVFLLREENKQLKTSDTSGASATSFSAKPEQPAGVPKEELEASKKQIDMLTTENSNLKQMLSRMKSQEEELNTGGIVSAMKKELAELASINQNLLAQKQELSRKNEQMRSQAQSAEQRKEDPEERAREKLIIEQLSKTNDRLMNEIQRLEDKVREFDMTRQSFISGYDN